MLPRAHGRALVCALVACFALAPATASGATADMRAAYWGATVYWGAEPCGGNVELVWADLAKELNALSRWTSFGDTPYSMPNANRDCRIEFNRAQLGRQDWQTLCSVAVHEVGHLLGNDHSDNPRDVMAHTYGGKVALCVKLAREARAKRTSLRARASKRRIARRAAQTSRR